MGEESGQVEGGSNGGVGGGQMSNDGTKAGPTGKQDHNTTDRSYKPNDKGSDSDHELRPPLPPRPTRDQLPTGIARADEDSLQFSKSSPRPQLRTTATTALSLTDIQTHSLPDGSRETYSSLSARSTANSGKAYGGVDRYLSRSGSEAGDTSSIRSYVPTLEAGGDVESLLGEVLSSGNGGQAWKRHTGGGATSSAFEADPDGNLSIKFRREFDALDELREDGSNEGMLRSGHTCSL